MREENVTRLIDVLEPAAERNGFEIVDVQILGGGGSPILRIYLDKEDGIDIDDIAEAQEAWLEKIVDEVDIIEGNYMLEVSSPGIDRPLRTRAHFEDYAGERVKVTTDPIDGRKRFAGVLAGMEGDNVVVESDDGERHEIPFDAIRKANIKGEVEFR